MSQKAKQAPVMPEPTKKVPKSKSWGPDNIVALVGHILYFMGGIAVAVIAGLLTQTKEPIAVTAGADSLVSSNGMVLFDFEKSVSAWQTLEGEYKPDRLSVSSRIVHGGKQSLEVQTEIVGKLSPDFASHNNEEIYLLTNPTIFLANPPETLPFPGPYNWTGKIISCQVFFPKAMGVDSANHPAYVRLGLKDKNGANSYGNIVYITPDNTEKWIKISAVDVNTGDPDPFFEPSVVDAITVNVETLEGSTLSYKGPFYIDDCLLGAP